MAAVLSGSNFANRLFRSLRARSMSVYCIFPEIPDTNDSENAVLRWQGLPEFSQFTTSKCYDAILKRSYEFHLDMVDYGDSLEGTVDILHRDQVSFDDAISPIEILEVPFMHCWSTVANLHMNGANLLPSNLMKRVNTVAENARTSKYRNILINRTFKDIKAGFAPLSDVQLRIIDLFLSGYRLGGYELSGDEKASYFSNLIKMKKNCDTFRGNLSTVDELFTHTVTDRQLVKGFPADVLSQMSPHSPDSGPWIVSFDPRVCQTFLEYCPDAKHRHNVWSCLNKRCSGPDARTNNKSLVEAIRDNKKTQASMLGYETYADMKLERTMAGSLANVQQMMATIIEGVLPSFKQDFVKLTDFSSSSGNNTPLNLCDLSYWRRLYREKVYMDCVEPSVHDFFDFNHCFNFLCQLSGELFGVEFQDISNQVELPHPDARCLTVLENGVKMATLFVDPFFRHSKLIQADDGFSMTTRPRSQLCDTSPICHLSYNLTHSQLSLSQLQVVFHQFGQSLVSQLCRAQYSQVYGLNGVEFDTVNIPGLVLRYWLSNANNLVRLSRHRATGEPLSPENCQRLLENDSVMTSFDLCYQLYLSELDLKLHSKSDAWQDIQEEAFRHFMPFEMEPGYSLVTSFVDSVAGGRDCYMYAPLWSRMVAADIWSAFDEASRRGDSVAQVGRQFRDTYLALGGSIHQSEVFRRFRGRDPTPEAFFRLYRLYNR